MRVLVVHIVLADVDHGQFPERRHVHDFVEHALTKRAFAEEANGDSAVAQALGGKCRAGGDAGAAADDRVRAQVPWRDRRCASNRPCPAVAGFLAEQFGEHAIGRRAFGEAVPVAAMRAGDVVVAAQRFANADSDGFLANIEMRQAGHQGTRVEIVDLLFEQADRDHLAVGAQPLLRFRDSELVDSEW